MKTLLTFLFFGCVLVAYSQPTSFPVNAGDQGNDSDTFIGNLAGFSNLPFAVYNTFVGDSSGYSNLSGNFNTFIGSNSGAFSQQNNQNTFIGSRSGQFFTGGSGGTFVGSEAGRNSIGGENSFFGVSAGRLSTGQNNTYMGYHSGALTVGDNNTFVGIGSGASRPNGGSENTYIGSHSGHSNAGARNAFLGRGTSNINSTASDNVLIGYYAGGYASGNMNTFIGTQSGASNTGSGSIFLGFQTGQNTQGSNLLMIDNSNTDNPFIWGNMNTNYLNLRGSVSIGVDPSAGETATNTLDVNGGARIRSLTLTTEGTHVVTTDENGNLFRSDLNVLIDSVAGDNLGNHIAEQTITADRADLDIGTIANAFDQLYLTGDIFLDGTQFIDNTNNSVSIGNNVLDAATTGTNNVAIGGTTSTANTTGSNNVAVGFRAFPVNTTGNNNTAIGSLSGPTFGGTNYSNSTAIGYNSRFTDSNQVRLGNALTTSIGGYAAFTNLSDGRFKDITGSVSGLDYVNSVLKPVAYKLNRGALSKHLHEEITPIIAENATHFGFIAQDLLLNETKKGLTTAVVDKPASEGTGVYGIRYEELSAVYAAAIQELSALVEVQNNRIAALERRLSDTPAGARQNTENSSEKNTGTSPVEETVRLDQNFPNPFYETTTISMVVPQTTKKAEVVLNDLQGKLVATYPVTGRGTTTIVIKANELSAGMFYYTLIADGNVTDTKRMILTK